MKAVYEKDSGMTVNAWYSFQGKPYEGPLPPFFDSPNWPWLENGRKNYKALRAEIEELLTKKSGALEPYFNTTLVREGGKWEVVNFYFWGKRNEENCSACPQLDALFKSIPGLLTAGLSRLAPHSEIKPHVGDTNTIARCHLGLSIPAGLPECGFRLKEESREWQEGEWLIFCDAYKHSAWNNTEQYRYILLLDVLLPCFEEERDDIVKNVRSMMKLQEVMLRNKWMWKLPGFVKEMLRRYLKRKV